MPAKILMYENPIFLRTYAVGEIYKNDPKLLTTNLLTQDVLIIHHTHNTGWTKIIEKIRVRAEKKLYTKIIYDYPYEAGLGPKDFEEFRQQIKEFEPYVLDVFYVLNKSMIIEDDNTHVFQLDYFAADIYDRYINYSAKASSMAIWQRPKPLSILVGKVDTKPSRLYTLYRLFEHGLLEDAMTGIINDWTDFNELKHLIKNDDFWNWLENNLGPVDYPEIVKLVTSGYPYSVKTYDYTKISVICETNTDEFLGPGSFITEKTYRPILCRTPFIMQGYQSHIDHLKSIGFDTYDRYLSNDRYLERNMVYYPDHEMEMLGPDHPRYEYINSIPIHAKELLYACEKHEPEISKIALENQRILLDHGKSEKQRLINAFKELLYS